MAQPQHSEIRLGVWVPNASETILRAEVTGLEDETMASVDTREDWETIWAKTWGGTPNPPSLPPIDFVLNSVVVAALGKRGGAGYSVSVDSVVTTTTGSVIYATTTSPGSRCNVTGPPSAPVHMVHFPGHPTLPVWRIANVLRV